MALFVFINTIVEIVYFKSNILNEHSLFIYIYMNLYTYLGPVLG